MEKLSLRNIFSTILTKSAQAEAYAACFSFQDLYEDEV